jgi:hypothetical protein
VVPGRGGRVLGHAAGTPGRVMRDG